MSAVPRGVSWPAWTCVGQFLQRLLHPWLGAAQPLGHALGLEDRLAVGVHHDLGPLPDVEQQFHALIVELLALVGQTAAPPGVQRGHQRQQQRTGGQIGEMVVAPDGVEQQQRLALGLGGRQIGAHLRHVRIPALDKGLDLLWAERSQHGLGKAGQPPCLALVGVGAAGQQDAHTWESTLEGEDGPP